MSRLFREATQLTTAGTVARVVEGELCRGEAQVHAASSAKGGRPTVSVVAEATRLARRVVAVARGGPPTGRFTGRLDPKCLDPRLFREAAQLKTVAADSCTTGVEVLHVEVQTAMTGIAGCGRATESVVPDTRQISESVVVSSVAEARGGVPGERGSRARGAYLVETTVGGFVIPCTVLFTGFPVRIIREGTGQRLIHVGRSRKVRPSPDTRVKSL